MGMQSGQPAYAKRERIADWWHAVYEGEVAISARGYETFRLTFRQRALALHRVGQFPDPMPALPAAATVQTVHSRRDVIATEIDNLVWRILSLTGQWRNLEAHHDADNDRDRDAAVLQQRLDDARATARLTNKSDDIERVRRVTAMLDRTRASKEAFAVDMQVLSEAIYDALLLLEEQLGLHSDLTNMTERLVAHATTLGRPTPVDDAVSFADYSAAFDTLKTLTEAHTYSEAWNLGLRNYSLVHPRDTVRETRRNEDQIMGIRGHSGLLLGGSMNQAGGRRR